MFTHIMLGGGDVERSRRFYDAALAALGIPVGGVRNNRVFYMQAGTVFGVGLPANGEAPTPANGGTISFKANDRDAVAAFHAAGLANGGVDEGAPGVRTGSGRALYGAYLRDPDGNKIAAFATDGAG